MLNTIIWSAWKWCSTRFKTPKKDIANTEPCWKTRSDDWTWAFVHFFHAHGWLNGRLPSWVFFPDQLEAFWSSGHPHLQVIHPKRTKASAVIVLMLLSFSSNFFMCNLSHDGKEIWAPPQASFILRFHCEIEVVSSTFLRFACGFCRVFQVWFLCVPMTFFRSGYPHFFWLLPVGTWGHTLWPLSGSSPLSPVWRGMRSKERSYIVPVVDELIDKSWLSMLYSKCVLY